MRYFSLGKIPASLVSLLLFSPLTMSNSSPPPLPEVPCRTLELDGVNLPADVMDLSCIQVTPDYSGDIADLINDLTGEKVVILKGSETTSPETMNSNDDDPATYTLTKTLTPGSGISIFGGLSNRGVVLESTQPKMVEPRSASTGTSVKKSYFQNLTLRWTPPYDFLPMFNTPCTRVNLTVADNNFLPKLTRASTFELFCSIERSISMSDQPVILFKNNSVEGTSYTLNEVGELSTRSGIFLHFVAEGAYNGKLEVTENAFQGPMREAMWLSLREKSSAVVSRNRVFEGPEGIPTSGFHLDRFGIVGHKQPPAYFLSMNNISAKNLAISPHPAIKICLAGNTFSARRVWNKLAYGFIAASSTEVANWCGDHETLSEQGLGRVSQTQNYWYPKNAMVSPCQNLQLAQGQIIFENAVCLAPGYTDNVRTDFKDPENSKSGSTMTLPLSPIQLVVLTTAVWIAATSL